LGGIEFDRAVSSLWEFHGRVLVGASILGLGRKVLAGDDFGLAIVQQNIFALLPLACAAAIDVTPDVLHALISLIAVRVRREKA